MAKGDIIMCLWTSCENVRSKRSPLLSRGVWVGCACCDVPELCLPMNEMFANKGANIPKEQVVQGRGKDYSVEELPGV